MAREELMAVAYETDGGDVILVGPGPKFGEHLRASAKRGPTTLVSHLGAMVGATLTARRPGILREDVVADYEEAIGVMDPRLNPSDERLAIDAVRLASEMGTAINAGMKAYREAQGGEA